MSVSVIVVCGRCSSCQQTQMLFRMPAFPTKKEKKVSSKYNYPIPPYEHTVHCCSTPSLHPFDFVAIQQCSSKYKYKMHAVSTKKSNINSNVNNLFIGCLHFPQKIRHLHLFLYSLLAAARPTQMLFKMPAFYTKKEKKGYFEIHLRQPPLHETIVREQINI